MDEDMANELRAAALAGDRHYRASGVPEIFGLRTRRLE